MIACTWMELGEIQTWYMWNHVFPAHQRSRQEAAKEATEGKVHPGQLPQWHAMPRCPQLSSKDVGTSVALSFPWLHVNANIDETQWLLTAESFPHVNKSLSNRENDETFCSPAMKYLPHSLNPHLLDLNFCPCLQDQLTFQLRAPCSSSGNPAARPSQRSHWQQKQEGPFISVASAYQQHPFGWLFPSTTQKAQSMTSFLSALLLLVPSL